MWVLVHMLSLNSWETLWMVCDLIPLSIKSTSSKRQATGLTSLTITPSRSEIFSQIYYCCLFMQSFLSGPSHPPKVKYSLKSYCWLLYSNNNRYERTRSTHPHKVFDGSFPSLYSGCGTGYHSVYPDPLSCECVPCPTGSYNDKNFTDSCTECPEGLTTSQEGSINISQCQMGKLDLFCVLPQKKIFVSVWLTKDQLNL